MRQHLRLNVLLPVAVLGLLGAGFGAFAMGGPGAPESLPVAHPTSSSAVDTGAADTTTAPPPPAPTTTEAAPPPTTPKPKPEAPVVTLASIQFMLDAPDIESAVKVLFPASASLPSAGHSA